MNVEREPIRREDAPRPLHELLRNGRLAAAREHAFMRALHSHALPTPRPCVLAPLVAARFPRAGTATVRALLELSRRLGAAEVRLPRSFIKLSTARDLGCMDSYDREKWRVVQQFTNSPR